MKTQETKDIPDGAMRLRSGLKTRQFGLDFGIYDAEEKIIYLLNPTASLILNYLPTGKPHREIALNIHISYGKSTATPSRVMNDLYKTIQFLQENNLIEEMKEASDEGIPKDIAFTEYQMTCLPMPYLPPLITGFTEEQMEEIKNPSVAFSDTWNPTHDANVMFSDTWHPDKNPAMFFDTWNPTQGMRAMFSDTWDPTKDPRTMFSDTWNPTKDPRTMFSDTWNPNTNPAMFADTWNPNMNPAMFADTWNPNMNPNQNPRTMFSDTWHPTKDPRTMFSDTWNPTKDPRAMFSDTWNPTKDPRAMFSDTWNPNMNPNQNPRTMFSDTWNPTMNPNAAYHHNQAYKMQPKHTAATNSWQGKEMQQPRTMFSDTWNPTKAMVKPARFLDTWNPQKRFQQPKFVDTWITEEMQSKESIEKPEPKKQTKTNPRKGKENK